MLRERIGDSDVPYTRAIEIEKCWGCPQGKDIRVPVATDSCPLATLLHPCKSFFLVTSFLSN